MFVAVDQSTAPTHFVVASCWLPLARVPEFEQKVLNLRIEQKYWREAHFQKLEKVESRAYEFLKSLLEAVLSKETGALFAVVIAANDDALTKAYFGGSFIQRDAVFMFELISRRYKWWNLGSEPYVIFDDMSHHDRVKEGDQEPEDSVRNEHISKAKEHLKKFTSKEVQCFSACRSHISSAIQVADLLAGLASLRHSINTGIFTEKKPANTAKLALLEWFEASAGIDLGIQTVPWKSRFSIWKHNSLARK